MFKKNVNQTHNLIDNVSENAKYTCQNPAILQDLTVPATEDSVQIHPNVCLRGILWITSSLICRWHTILVLMKV